MKKFDVIVFLAFAIYQLELAKNYAETWVELKMEFARKFQQGMVFSTRFGADFFEEAYRRVENNSPIVVTEEMRKQGIHELLEFDVNFNKWLKNLK